MNDFFVYLVLFFSILLSSVAQVFQKMAASTLLDNKPRTLLRSPYIWLSFLCLGVGLLLWLVVLSAMPVSQAYPIMSLSYIVVMLLARWLFKERIPARRWVGAALILLGVSCLMGAS
jgi:undecaprenyl phosphate-alpha-L-ara4N flippase subunit ArnE